MLMQFLQTSLKNFYFAMLDLKTLPDRSQFKKVKNEQDKKFSAGSLKKKKKTFKKKGLKNLASTVLLASNVTDRTRRSH